MYESNDRNNVTAYGSSSKTCYFVHVFFHKKKREENRKKPNALNIVFLSFSFPSGYSSVIHTNTHSLETLSLVMKCYVMSCHVADEFTLYTSEHVYVQWFLFSSSSSSFQCVPLVWPFI